MSLDRCPVRCYNESTDIEQTDLDLFYMDSNYLSYVRILYRDVNWHGVLPFLFIFVLFFHCGTKFATACPRVVNIINATCDWLFRQ